MILKSLYLKIGDLGLPTEYTYGFLKRSRCVCNYIEREVLKSIRFQSDGFNRISIAMCSEPSREPFVNSSKVLCVDLPFDRKGYDALQGDEVLLFCIDAIGEGVRALSKSYLLPQERILKGLNEFVLGGMENKWVHKKRKFRSVGLMACLNCQLTQDAFTLTLDVFKGEDHLFDSCILRTDPDENAYEYKFKDIRLEGDQLVVTSQAIDPLYRVSLSEFRESGSGLNFKH